jgi:hypothetical protein
LGLAAARLTPDFGATLSPFGLEKLKGWLQVAGCAAL